MKNLAVFDLDHTLILCDSDLEWANFLLAKGILDPANAAQRLKYYDDYASGCLDMDEFLRFQLAPLARFSRAELDKLHREFFAAHILPHICTSAENLVKKHRDRGDELFVVSATNEFIVTPIAQYFGIENIIGVQLETDENGNYTGNYHGIPSFREGKITRLQERLAKENKTFSDYAATYFYSDSHNDLPLLKIVDYPAAVNPDEKLRRYAEENHWKIIEFTE